MLAGRNAQPKYEIRASWVTTLGGMDWPRHKANSPEGIKRQKEELCQLLDQLKEANFNTVLFQTRLRGDVIYPSAYEPFAESITGFTGRVPAYDPLAFAVEECHKRGMEIHAWFVSIPIGNDRQMRLHGKNAVAKKLPGRNRTRNRHQLRHRRNSFRLHPLPGPGHEISGSGHLPEIR